MLGTSDTIKKKSIGKVNNNMLQLLPRYTGIYDIELKSIDKYGNTIINNNEALLNVK